MSYTIILRNCPPGLTEYEGRRFDKRYLGGFHIIDPRGYSLRGTFLKVTFHPTGRTETLEDGTKAEIYEPRRGEE